MIRINWTSVSLVALVMTVASLTPPAASGQTSPGAGSDSRIASAQGKEVRITAMDGSRRKGKLVSLSASEVVFQDDGRSLTMGLGDVRKVERISRHVREGLLIGALGGILVGNAMDDSCDDCGFEQYLGLGVGAGIGAGVGAILNAASAYRNLIYQAPESSVSVSVAPMLSPRRAGLALTMRW
jgi:hypothetical protein